jgi:hypothetical protein
MNDLIETTGNAKRSNREAYMRRSLAFTAFFAVCIFVSICDAQAEKLNTAVGKDSEWRPTAEILSKIRAKCANLNSASFTECLTASVHESGASSGAVAFLKQTGNTGFANEFLKVGPVDMVFVEYPFRANENQGWLLVNGTPGMIDVDNRMNELQDRMKEDPNYTRLKEKYPNIMVFPGDRTQRAPPEVVRRPGEELRFVVEYKLLDGCHACEQVGKARFGWDFNSGGKFVGTTLLDVN